MSITRSTAPQLFVAKLSVRKFCPEMGHPGKCSGGAGGATQPFGPCRVLRYTQYPEKLYIAIMVYINFAQGCSGATQNADP